MIANVKVLKNQRRKTKIYEFYVAH
jgi:hypothetical protein